MTMTEKAKTIDGARTRVDELNLGDSDGPESEVSALGRLRRWYRNFSLVLAGMYTGLNCYGTPKTEHEYEEGSQQKPDNRLI